MSGPSMLRDINTGTPSAAQSRPMRVTVTQMDGDEGEARLEEQWAELKKYIAAEKPDLVLLPEMIFSIWFPAGEKFVESVWDDAVERHKKWAPRLAELGAPAVIGTFPIYDDGGVRRQAMFVYSRATGELKFTHNKAYLPNEPTFYEARWYERGTRDASGFVPFEVPAPNNTVSLATCLICTELWWPEHGRDAGVAGAAFVFTPRATGNTGAEDYWIAAGRTAATLAGAYSLSSNRFNQRLGLGGVGWIITPDGDVLATTSQDQPFVTLEVDLEEAVKARLTYPRYAI